MQPSPHTRPNRVAHDEAGTPISMQKNNNANGYIYDIGGSNVQSSLREKVRKAFIPDNEQQQRSFPKELFFEGDGGSKWRRITSSPTYYQMNAEIQLLDHHARDIAREIAPGSTVLDMGSGDVRKVCPLLLQLEEAQVRVDYYAVDISHPSLEANMKALSSLKRPFQFVRFFALWGTFQDCFDLLESFQSPITILSFGTTFANDQFDLAVTGLMAWAQIMKANHRILLGQDAQSNGERIWNSYHDEQGLWEDFLRGGLRASNDLLGYNWFSDKDWELDGRIQNNPTAHNFSIRALRKVTVPELGLHILAGDSIEFFTSYKYKQAEMDKMFQKAGLRELKSWKAPNEDFCKLPANKTPRK